MNFVRPRAEHPIDDSVQDVDPAERSLMLRFLLGGFAALTLGASLGPLQGLNYAGINAYRFLSPVLHTYYQGLTLHGVLNAYVFTFFVSSGLLVYLPARELRLKPNITLWRACLYTLSVGTVFILAAVLSNTASVLWTFYPPLKASPVFYLGLTILVAGSLLPIPIVLDLRRRWKKANPGRLTPLVTYMSSCTVTMWGLAFAGIGSELLLELDPWALGLRGQVDPLLCRTLFWWTGHPIVYFWLMPAYISWYALLPRQAGGKLVSDPMARLTFALLLVFSLPLGTHHQFDDPGISPVWKGILSTLTLSVAIPSLITAFTLGLTLEYAGRLRGGVGWTGWFRALPWRDPSVAAQVLAMVTFIFGGAGGIVNGSWQLDNVVHNTTWIPGHFHLTVGTATTMTFMGIAFWMMPHLTGRALLSRRLALLSAWFWFGGMSLFSLGMHWSGLLGVPRRAWISLLPASTYQQLYGSAHIPLMLVAVGGLILWLALIAFVVTVLGGLLNGRVEVRADIPFAATFGGRESASSQVMGTTGTQPIGIVAAPVFSPLAKCLEHLGLIASVALTVSLAAYIPILVPILSGASGWQGWDVW